MRYRSLLDYLLVNAVLLRERLPLARFAPGVSTVWFRPLREVLVWFFRQRRRARASAHAACAALVAHGEPVLLFMRSQAVAGRRRRELAAARLGSEYLHGLLRTSQIVQQPVFLVPVAIFRGKGFRRKESRLATLLYSVQDAPGEAKRLFNYLWNVEETQLTLGREIVLGRFVEEYRRESEERLVRRLARALQIFLYREERLVWGPARLPRRPVPPPPAAPRRAPGAAGSGDVAPDPPSHRGAGGEPYPGGARGTRVLRRDGRQLQRPLFRDSGGRLQLALEARLLRARDHRPGEGHRGG